MARDGTQRRRGRQGALSTALIPQDRIERAILLLRGQRVLLDADLAELYGVPTKAFNQAVKRNTERFPPDFRFQLSKAERDEVVTNCDHLQRLKFSPVLPWAFTEHGAIMAANVLNSARAVAVSIVVVRAFVRLRQVIATHKDLAQRIERLEGQFGHKSAEREAHIEQIYALLEELMAPHDAPKREPIGFASEGGDWGGQGGWGRGTWRERCSESGWWRSVARSPLVILKAYGNDAGAGASKGTTPPRPASAGV